MSADKPLGTWLDSQNASGGDITHPSNVARIGFAIKDEDYNGRPQIVYYQNGVGSQGGIVMRVAGGLTGEGIKENIREAYSFIATNYMEGDEIYLLGFSRGAFTARSVGGMIGDFGLLTKAGLPFFGEIFEDYIHREDPVSTSLGFSSLLWKLVDLWFHEANKDMN